MTPNKIRFHIDRTIYIEEKLEKAGKTCQDYFSTLKQEQIEKEI